MTVRLLRGDCREVLPTLEAESVHCVVTSPPYFGLRDYGTAKWEGGDPACDHEPTKEWLHRNFNANSGLGSEAKTQSAAAKTRWYRTDGSCPSCGARRIDSQIGLEPTPSCGMHGQVRLRAGLSKDQLEFVVQRLKDAGLLDAALCDMGGTE